MLNQCPPLPLVPHCPDFAHNFLPAQVPPRHHYRALSANADGDLFNLTAACKILGHFLRQFLTLRCFVWVYPGMLKALLDLNWPVWFAHAASPSGLTYSRFTLRPVTGSWVQPSSISAPESSSS